MVKRMRSFFAVVMLVIAATVNAQVTTSSMSGKVVDQSNEAIIGATIQAIHEPSGTHYGAITNVDGRYSIQGMRAGGPYKVEVSYVGYQSVVYKSINLQLGENYVLDANLKESTELLDEVVITASKSSNMKSDRARSGDQCRCGQNVGSAYGEPQHERYHAPDPSGSQYR